MFWLDDRIVNFTLFNSAGFCIPLHIPKLCSGSVVKLFGKSLILLKLVSKLCSVETEQIFV